MNYDDFIVGYKGVFTKIVTDEDNELFAKLSGDFNPIHFRDDVGQKAGFRARISNGFVQESRIAAALVETFGSENTVVVALKKDTRFLKPVYIGDEITATVEVVDRLASSKVLKIKAECVNAKSERVVATNMIIKILPLEL